MNKINLKAIGTALVIMCAGIIVGLFSSCGLDTAMAARDYAREEASAAYTSEYAKTVNKLEMAEGNFSTLRRVVFYNVRLGETVFACEGYCHVKVDSDGDIELVIKTGPQSYLRHYLGQKQDITYFSEQIASTTDVKNYKYQITFNPRLWIPEITSEVGR